MRCKNCGWPNKPSETVCVKCGSPLDAEPTSPEYENNYDSPESVGHQEKDGLKKTVLESNVFNNHSSVVSPEPMQTVLEETVCPKCGYPLRADAIKCPNCNSLVNGNQENRPNNASTNSPQRRPTRVVNTPNDSPEPQQRPVVQARTAKPKAEKFKGTINPYMMSIPVEPSIILKPLQRMNERKVVDATELELDGGEITLTRDNTEPGNPSITSKEQAIISYEEGKWYIENRSEQNTTFVLATNKIEIHDGDIILLGNRMFEFTEQS